MRVRSAPTHDVLSKEMPAVSQPYFSTVTVTPRPVDPVSKQYFTFFSLFLHVTLGLFLSEQSGLFFHVQMAFLTVIPTGMICADEACGNGGPRVGLSPEDKLGSIGGSP